MTRTLLKRQRPIWIREQDSSHKKWLHAAEFSALDQNSIAEWISTSYFHCCSNLNVDTKGFECLTQKSVLFCFIKSYFCVLGAGTQNSWFSFVNTQKTLAHSGPYCFDLLWAKCVCLCDASSHALEPARTNERMDEDDDNVRSKCLKCECTK